MTQQHFARNEQLDDARANNRILRDPDQSERKTDVRVCVTWCRNHEKLYSLREIAITCDEKGHDRACTCRVPTRMRESRANKRTRRGTGTHWISFTPSVVETTDNNDNRYSPLSAYSLCNWSVLDPPVIFRSSLCDSRDKWYVHASRIMASTHAINRSKQRNNKRSPFRLSSNARIFTREWKRGPDKSVQVWNKILQRKENYRKEKMYVLIKIRITTRKKYS